MGTYGKLLEARDNLEAARDALNEIIAMGVTASELMRDHAYAAVATWVDKVDALTAIDRAELDAWYAAGCPDEEVPPTDPTGFDVPGTITLADVSKPQRGETAEARAYRLAQKALIEGVRILSRDQHAAIVSSGSKRGAIYRVTLDRPRCTCPAGDGICKHRALVAALDGRLSEPTGIAA